MVAVRFACKSAPYDTTRFGDQPIGQCLARGFEMRILPNGFVVRAAAVTCTAADVKGRGSPAGFTLIEMIVVIVIMAMVGGLVLVSSPGTAPAWTPTRRCER